MDKRMQQQQGIDLLECFEAWRKHVGFVGKITVGFGLVAGLYLIAVPSTYEAASTIRIKPDKGIGASMLDVGGGGSNTNLQTMNTYMSIVKTPDVLMSAVKKAEKAQGKAKPIGFGNVITTMQRNTDLVTVAVRSNDAKYAKSFNDALLDSFMDKLTDMGRQQSTVTRVFLEGRVKEAKQELNKTEDKLIAFQKQHRLVSPENTVEMTASKLSNADKLKAENRINMEIANAKASVAEAQMQGKDLPAIADSPSITALNKKLGELDQKKAEFATKYTAKHPEMIKLEKDIAAIEDQLIAESKRVARLQRKPSGLYGEIFSEKLKSEAESAVAASNLEAIARIEKEYQDDIERMSDLNKEHLGLIRDTQLSQEIYTLLAKRLEEAKVAEFSVAREVQIVQKAAVPEAPVLPNKPRTMGIALLLGFILSSAYAIGREMMNRTIKSSDDVEKYLGLPVLGMVPDYDDMQKHMEGKDDKPKGLLGRLGMFLW